MLQTCAAATDSTVSHGPLIQLPHVGQDSSPARVLQDPPRRAKLANAGLQSGSEGAVSLAGKKIHIPPMAYGSAKAFAAAFRAVGLDAQPTPPSDHRTSELGARYTSGDE